MSRSDRHRFNKDLGPSPRWLLIIAFVLAFAGGGSLSLQLSDYLSSYKYETANADYYAAECYRLELSKPALVLHTDPNDVKTKKAEAEAKWHADYAPYCDLAAQFLAANSAKSSKNYTAWTLFLTALGVLLIWRTMVFTARTLEAADRTLDAAVETTELAKIANKNNREIGIEQNRARLYFKSGFAHDLGSGSIHNIGANDTINFTAIAEIENIGKTSAIDVRASARLLITELDHFIVMQTEFSGPINLGIVQAGHAASFGNGVFKMPAIQPFILHEFYETFQIHPDYLIYIDVCVEFTDVYFTRRYVNTGFIQQANALTEDGATFTRVANRDEEGIIESPDEHDDYDFPA